MNQKEKMWHGNHFQKRIALSLVEHFEKWNASCSLENHVRIFLLYSNVVFYNTTSKYTKNIYNMFFHFKFFLFTSSHFMLLDGVCIRVMPQEQ
jgi:hypothetical protein